jgi:hypothetical protein
MLEKTPLRHFYDRMTKNVMHKQQERRGRYWRCIKNNTLLKKTQFRTFETIELRVSRAEKT